MNGVINIEREKQEKQKKKIVIIYHHDVDGLASSALVVRALGRSVEAFSHDPNEEFPMIEADEVFIVDIAITEKTWGSVQNIRSSKITWVDHHRPFAELSYLKFPANVQIVLDPSSPSAVKLVQKYFSLNDEVSQKITDLGTKADMWQITPFVQDWMNLDTAYSYYQKDKTILIEALSRGDFEISGERLEVLNAYLQEKEKAIKELLQNTFVKEVKGHLVAVGLAPGILSGSESADIVLKATNSEIQIILKTQGWMSFRRAKTSSVNLLALAKIWNGGGHEYASGAELGKTVSEENFSAVASEIFEKISQVL